MFDSLSEFINKKFNNEQNQTPSIEKMQLATAVLMFEVIKADSQVDDTEIEHLHSILKTEFSLPEQDLSDLVELAKKTAEESISLQGFTRTVCEHWDNQQRMQLLTNLWVIAFADGRIDTHERHIIRKIAALLYLNDKQIIQTRETAKSK